MTWVSGCQKSRENQHMGICILLCFQGSAFSYGGAPKVIFRSAQITEQKALTFFLNESQDQIKKSRRFQLRAGIYTTFHLDLCWHWWVLSAGWRQLREDQQEEMHGLRLRWAVPTGTSFFRPKYGLCKVAEQQLFTSRKSFSASSPGWQLAAAKFE